MSERVFPGCGVLKIKRCCYFPEKRPRVWWWKIVEEPRGRIFADGFSTKAEARRYLDGVRAALAA